MATATSLDEHDHTGHQSTLYQDLDTTKREFRLVRLLRSSADPMTLELGVFALDDDVEWEALSYLWGQEVAMEEVAIGGTTIRIRPGLYDLLIHMYQEDRRGWFFIDALCINQHNGVERSSQLLLMRSIYRNAQKVIVWLHVDHDFYGLRQGGPLKLQSAEHQDKYCAHLCRCGFRKGPVSLRELDPRDAPYVSFCAAKTQYWERLWIVQELLLGRYLELRAGCILFNLDELLAEVTKLISNAEKTLVSDPSLIMKLEIEDHMPYENVIHRRTAAREFMRRYGLQRTQDLCVGMLQDIQRFSRDLRSGLLLSWPEALVLFAHRDCSEPVDKIFALLGIVESRIVPDYTMSQAELFTAAIADCFVGPTTEVSRTHIVTVLASVYRLFQTSPSDPLTYLIISRVLAFFQDNLWAPSETMHHVSTLEWFFSSAACPVEFDTPTTYLNHIYSHAVKMVGPGFLDPDNATAAGFGKTTPWLEMTSAKLDILALYMDMLRQRDWPLTSRTGGEETKKYSEWVGIIDTTCQRLKDRAAEMGLPRSVTESPNVSEESSVISESTDLDSGLEVRSLPNYKSRRQWLKRRETI